MILSRIEINPINIIPVIIALDAISIVFLGVIIFGCNIENTTNRRQTRIFTILAALGILGTAADLLSYVFAGEAKYASLMWMLDGLTLVIAAWFGVSYCMYILERVRTKVPIPKWYILGIGLWGLIVTIFIIAGVAKGDIFYIVDGAFIAGKLYFWCLALVLSIGIYSAFLSIRFVKILGVHDSIALLAYVLAPIVTSIIEAVIPNLAITYVGMGLALLILYIFIQSNEIKTTKLDANAAQAKADFFAKFSHELRAPINAIVGLDELILRETQEEETLSNARDIKSASSTLLDIINDILDSSRIEASKVKVLPVSYEPITLIHDIANMITSRAEAKKIKFYIDVDPQLPSKLVGDATKVKQIVTNLLTNAVKYTETGRAEFHLFYDTISERKIMVHVVVKDTGIGIRSEDMDKIFTPFSRVDEVRNRNVEGTGLGMFITQKFLELMGSRLEVKSEYGVGSTFSFDLVQEVEDATPIGDYSIAIKKLRSEKYVYKESFVAEKAQILVVDDSAVNLKIVKSLLKKTLVNCDCVDSGSKAIDSCKKTKYHMIFMDQNMPQMMGEEALSAIRADVDGMNCDTKIIALTADATPGIREVLLSKGYDDYLMKPIDYKQLEQIIVKYLPKDIISNS